MLGINVKRGVESTLERVFNNTGRQFDTLSFLWTGKTAGVVTERFGGAIEAKVIFPNIDETKDVPNKVFTDLIGYALHELGHVWFTDDEPWHIARDNHGEFVSNLINGLEDPRIERRVIESGYAPNSRSLFEGLIDSVLERDGYVEPDDLKNVPFLLAIEGRRLNGYPIRFPSIVDASPWAVDLHWALTEANRASNTQKIAEIAIELHKRLQQAQPKRKKDDKDGKQDGQPGKDGKQGDQGGQEGQPGGQPGQPGEQPGEEPSDQGNQPGGKGDKSGDKPGDKPGKKGKGTEPREVEPRSFIEDRLAPHQSTADQGDHPRPSVSKPVIEEIHFI